MSEEERTPSPPRDISEEGDDLRREVEDNAVR